MTSFAKADYVLPVEHFPPETIHLELRLPLELLSQREAIVSAIEKEFSEPVRVRVIEGELGVGALSPTDIEQLSPRQAARLDAQLDEFERRAAEAMERAMGRDA